MEAPFGDISYHDVLEKSTKKWGSVKTSDILLMSQLLEAAGPLLVHRCGRVPRCISLICWWQRALLLAPQSYSFGNFIKPKPSKVSAI